MSYQPGDSFPVDERSPDAPGKARPHPEDKLAGFEQELGPRSLPVGAFAFLVASLLVCGGLIVLGLSLRQSRAPRRSMRNDRFARARTANGLRGIRLSGPGNVQVFLPQDGPAIVNVFLERCPDCMPAFRAYRELEAPLTELGVPVINVAYRQASAFSEEYGLGDNLVVDRGPALVEPLGIRSFTTLVLNDRGQVLARLRPTEADYRRRVADAVDAAW